MKDTDRVLDGLIYVAERQSEFNEEAIRILRTIDQRLTRLEKKSMEEV